MTMLRQTAIRVGLDALYFSGACHLVGDRFGGVGLVLTLHHVRPARADAFQPNRSLEVTPEFLEQAIRGLRSAGFDLVSLDEVDRRLRTGRFERRFAAFTFDDGYRDNLVWAYPILARNEVPFTVFVTTDFAEGRGHVWWQTLERVLAANPEVSVVIDGRRVTFACRTVSEKYAAARAIDRELGALRSEQQVRAAVDQLAREAGIDVAVQCAEVCLGWAELHELASDPLVTIGAHTISHPNLRKLPPEAARREMEQSALRIERALGVRPVHLAYPFGHRHAAGPEEFSLAAELGFKTALTTRPSVLMPGSASQLTSLPRISLNGYFQRQRHVLVLASGLATAAANILRRGIGS